MKFTSFLFAVVFFLGSFLSFNSSQSEVFVFNNEYSFGIYYVPQDTSDGDDDDDGGIIIPPGGHD